MSEPAPDERAYSLCRSPDKRLTALLDDGPGGDPSARALASRPGAAQNGTASLRDLAAERGAWENRATLPPARGGRREADGPRGAVWLRPRVRFDGTRLARARW